MTHAELDVLMKKVTADHDFVGNFDGVVVDSKPEDVHKDGYVLEPVVFDAHHIGWQFVKDEDYRPADGCYTNPIPWESGMQIYAGVNPDYVADGWYVYNDLVQRCIKDGCPKTFTAKTYWEVIE